MPYRQVYEPEPKDPTLEVVTELPDGITEQRSMSFRLREARGSGDRYFEVYTYCSDCGGWVKSQSNMYTVNNLNSRALAGRSGMEYYCVRCAKQLAFHGIMS